MARPEEMASRYPSATGLGYLGRDSTDALALHVPLGALIFGITSLITNAAFANRSLRQQTAEQNDV